MGRFGVRGRDTSDVYEGATEVTEDVSGSRVYRGSGSGSWGKAVMELVAMIDVKAGWRCYPCRVMI